MDVDAPGAWDITKGSSSIVVGVIDTGIDYTHPDLAANVWSNPGDIGGCGAGTHGYDFASGDCDPMDEAYNSHGTADSGVIGAVGDNGVGIAGINWRSKIIGLKIFDSSGVGMLSARHLRDRLGDPRQAGRRQHPRPQQLLGLHRGAVAGTPRHGQPRRGERDLLCRRCRE